jgi:hypothetical protein
MTPLYLYVKWSRQPAGRERGLARTAAPVFILDSRKTGSEKKTSYERRTVQSPYQAAFVTLWRADLPPLFEPCQ